jgi:deazaflavin-dependent oxidoreductase (nitroreductase family)
MNLSGTTIPTIQFVMEEVMTKEYRQDVSGTMTYPKRGTFWRVLYKIPQIQWRMGLGPYLSHESRGGSKMLVLTTWGRKSQKPRYTMLSYSSVGEKVFVCSGWGQKSDWYKNLAANPHVTIQVGSETLPAKARRVVEFEEFQQVVDEMFETGGDSHFIPWLKSYGINPNPQDMLEKRDRLYLITFDLIDEPGPPAMPADLKWVWGLILLLLVVVAMMLLR